MKVGLSRGMGNSLEVNLQHFCFFVCFWQWWTVLCASSNVSPKTLWRIILCVTVVARLPQTRRMQIRYVLPQQPLRGLGTWYQLQTLFLYYEALG